MVLFFLIVLLGMFISIVFWSVRNGIVPMPSSPGQTRALLTAIPEDLTGTIFELGSGWGTLAISLSKKFPRCRIIGYENSLLPYLFSKCLAVFYALPNLQLKRGNFLKMPLHEASAVVCYLFPGGMRKLKSKLEEELTPETWVVSNTFAMPGWTASRILEVKDLYRTKIYVYQYS